MRAYEFIKPILRETNDCVPGWQEPDITVLNGNIGTIIIGIRLDQSCNVVEVKFLYYNENIPVKMIDDVVYGITIQNSIVYEYDIRVDFGKKRLSSYQGDKDIDNIKNYFLKKITEYLILKETNMKNNKEITISELLKMNPGLNEKLESALKSYGKPYNSTFTNTVLSDNKILKTKDKP